MTEKEKMLSGELYNAGDTELMKDRAVAKNMCFEYNKLTSSEIIKKITDIIKYINLLLFVIITINNHFLLFYYIHSFYFITKAN